MFLRRRGVLPGFGLSLGYTVFYLGFIVLLPLGALVLKASSVGFVDLFRSATETRALSAYWLSLYASLIGASLNGVFGLLLAWVLVRYEFPGKSIVDALVDLPFALPTAVAGIALTTVYAENGVLGSILGRVGVRAAFTPLGIIIALTFVGIPFVVRTVQPVLEGLDDDVEEAAAILGATRFQTFVRVIFPALLPSLLTGFALALARALGEYGSVVFISGNMPRKTEIAPVLIVTKLEQYDYAGATAIASVMLGASFLLLLLVNLLSRWARRAET
ncbi:MAG TPA: sulfate ABC transporter permease subunit CysT [Polyangiaceae bacterium]|jgi:sulfate transport system permease protein|nr:sulfate ABC transporter permease subunit CysT [Polyangiaceae bacterium]